MWFELLSILFSMDWWFVWLKLKGECLKLPVSHSFLGWLTKWFNPETSMAQWDLFSRIWVNQAIEVNPMVYLKTRHSCISLKWLIKNLCAKCSQVSIFMGSTWVDSANCSFESIQGKKISRNFQKAKLEFVCIGNYLHSI